jgi:hypothetical protein
MAPFPPHTTHCRNTISVLLNRATISSPSLLYIPG